MAYGGFTDRTEKDWITLWTSLASSYDDASAHKTDRELLEEILESLKPTEIVTRKRNE